MTINNDYLHLQIAAQRQRELHAQAANDRLARQAMAGRTPWWRRLADTAGQGSRPARALGNGVRAGYHGVAHSR